jgi:acetyl esterase/lipase
MRRPARASLIALAVAAAAMAWSHRRFEPPVILRSEQPREPGGPVLFGRGRPRDAIAQEIEAAPGVRLRGILFPSDPGAPLVLHLLDAGASVDARQANYGIVFEQLADLGIASLAFDYSGVGRSGGERSPANLARDVGAMWRHAVELAGGDPGRVAVRGVSLGTLAIAELLHAGARPPVVVLVAPVHPRTVASRFAKLMYGDLAGALARWIFRPAIGISIEDLPLGTGGELLVITAEGDELVGEAEQSAMRRAVAGAGGAWRERAGGHLVVAIEARRLFEEELDVYSRALCPDPPQMQRCAAALTSLSIADGHMAAGTPEFDRFLALALVARGRARLTAAVAHEIEDVALAARVRRWMMATDYARGSMEQLSARVNLADPAGPLDFDEIESASRGDVVASLGISFRTFLTWPSLLALADRADHGGIGSHGGGIGDIDVEVTFDRDALWKRLEARGLRGPDLRRHFFRILLKAQGTPERLLRGDDGRWLLEVCDFRDGWVVVDPERPPSGEDASGFTMSLQLPH